MTASFHKEQCSIVIPTYNRGPLLLDTIRYLLAMYTDIEIFIVDQTQEYPTEISEQLGEWHDSKKINWLKRSKPSVVSAMNTGLLASKSDYVIFLDDDIRPCEQLIEEYLNLVRQSNYGIVAGRVIQPWDDPKGVLNSDREAFSFNALDNGAAEFFIGANFLVNRDITIKVGGFDENFKGTAHDYEREFSDRIKAADYKIGYCGAAAVHHLKEEAGGIRTYGHFLKTAKPHHAVGAYYYILRSELVRNKPYRILQRLIERVATKTHLKQPWWIPLTLFGDLLGIGWAIYLRLSGPKHIDRYHQ